MMPNRLRLLLPFIVIAACLPVIASAQLQLTITNPNAVVQLGTTINFMGTLVNVSLTDSYQFDSAQIDDAFIDVTTFTQLPLSGANVNSALFNPHGNFSAVYAPGDSFTGIIFSITVSPSALTGSYPLYPGNPAIIYFSNDVTTGGGQFATNGPTNMSVTVVSAVPEPSGLFLLAAGGSVFLACWLKRARA